MKTRQKLHKYHFITVLMAVLFLPSLMFAQSSEDIHAPVDELTISFTEPVIDMPDPHGSTTLETMSEEVRLIKTYLQELDSEAVITRYMPEFRTADTLSVNARGETSRSYDWSTVYTFNLSSQVPFYEVREELESFPQIEWVDPPIIIEPATLPDDYGMELNQWNLDNVSAGSAWGITQGDDLIRAMVLDDGIRPHDDINNKIVNPGQDFDGNHGLRVAGILGAETDNNLGLASLGWETMLVDGSFEENSGPFWIQESHSSSNPNHISEIINMSFSTFTCFEFDQNNNCIDGDMLNSGAYSSAVDAASNAGVIMVASAGNTQPNWHSGSWPTEQWPAA